MLRSPRFFIFALGMLAGLTIGLVYGYARIHNLQKADQTRIKEINRRLNQVRQKYAQGLVSQATCDDEKQAILNEAAKLRGEKEHLAADSKSLKVKVDSLEASKLSMEKKNSSSETKTALLESKNGQLTERLAEVEADRNALEQKQKQTFKALQEREKDLKQLDQKYNVCAEHNARLYAIGNELIGRYQNKGFTTTLLEKEPFTQIKRVELEKLVRDYKDKVDQQKVRSK